MGRPDALDLVVVATPNRQHVPMARAALAAGLPVVVDKPLAPTAAEGRALVDEAAERGLPLTRVPEPALGRRLPDRPPAGRGRASWAGAPLRVPLRALAADDQAGLAGARRPRARPAAPSSTSAPTWSTRRVQLFGPVDAGLRGGGPSAAPGAAVDDDAFVALTHADGVRSHLWMGAVDRRSSGRACGCSGDRAGYTSYGLDVQEAALRDGGRPDQPGWGEVPPDRYGLLGVDGDLRPVPTEPGALPELLRAGRGGAARRHADAGRPARRGRTRSS